ncbi:MAG TPA: hypothetical protein VMJ33_11075 [Gallionella sp.]|nr:hypothetical protein [Gallionella sp.]
MKSITALLCVLVCFVQPVWAGNIDSIGSLTQSQFKTFSEDISSAVSYKPVTPAEPLGILGFDLGIEATETKLQDPALWTTATSGTFTSSSVVLPKLHVFVGLPFNIDLGAVYSEAPSTNIKVYGGEIRYAFIEGGTATPAVAIRGSYTQMTGVDQLSFNTKGLDVSISKGITIFTPYAGLGEVWSDSTPNGIPTLTKESFNQFKYFIGGNLKFLFMNVALEYDKTGSDQSYSAKLGIRF